MPRRSGGVAGPWRHTGSRPCRRVLGDEPLLGGKPAPAAPGWRALDRPQGLALSSMGGRGERHAARLLGGAGALVARLRRPGSVTEAGAGERQQASSALRHRHGAPPGSWAAGRWHGGRLPHPRCAALATPPAWRRFRRLSPLWPLEMTASRRPATRAGARTIASQRAAAGDRDPDDGLRRGSRRRRISFTATARGEEPLILRRGPRPPLGGAASPASLVRQPSRWRRNLLCLPAARRRSARPAQPQEQAGPSDEREGRGATIAAARAGVSRATSLTRLSVGAGPAGR